MNNWWIVVGNLDCKFIKGSSVVVAVCSEKRNQVELTNKQGSQILFDSAPSQLRRILVERTRMSSTVMEDGSCTYRSKFNRDILSCG
jgi:hypothetical protein